MGICVRCRKERGELDACAKCGSSLCGQCMTEGCCEVVPAVSELSAVDMLLATDWEQMAETCRSFREAA